LIDALVVVGAAVVGFVGVEMAFRDAGPVARTAGAIVIWGGLAAAYSVRPLRAWRQLESSALAS
jgi:hypothetical protein